MSRTGHLLVSLVLLCAVFLAQCQKPLTIKVLVYQDEGEEHSMIVEWWVGPGVVLQSTYRALLYINREYVDEEALTVGQKEGKLEGPLDYIIGNFMVQVDVLDLEDNIVLQDRLILTGYPEPLWDFKTRAPMMDPSTEFPSEFETGGPRSPSKAGHYLTPLDVGPAAMGVARTHVPDADLGNKFRGLSPCTRKPWLHSRNDTVLALYAILSSDAEQNAGWFTDTTKQVKTGRPHLETYSSRYETWEIIDGCFSGSIFPCKKHALDRQFGCIAVWNETMNLKTATGPYGMPFQYVPGQGRFIPGRAHQKVLFWTRRWVQNHQHFLMDWLCPIAPALDRILSDPEVMIVAPYSDATQPWLEALGLADRVLPFVGDNVYCAHHAWYPVWEHNDNSHVLRTPEMMLAANALVNKLVPPAGGERRDLVIYLSRKGLVTGRNVANDDEVVSVIQAAMARHGIGHELDILLPHKLSVKERIARFRRAQTVIGIHGGAMANLIFTPMGADVGYCAGATSVVEFVAQDYWTAESSYDVPFLSYWYRGFAAALKYHLVGMHGDPQHPTVDAQGLEMALDAIWGAGAK